MTVGAGMSMSGGRDANLDSPPLDRPTRRHALLVGVLLAVQAVLLAHAARRDSPTWDEPGHLAAGVAHWRHGTFNLYRVNPPLVRGVATLALVLADPTLDVGTYPRAADPAERYEWQAGTYLLAKHGERFFRLIAYARWSCIPLVLLGGWVCYLWARDLFGPAPGLFAATLWAFCPNVLGHGHLIGPDAAAASLGVATGYAFWRWLDAPSWRRAVVAGVVLGLAELTKTTWIVLLPLLPAIWAASRVRRTAGARQSLRGEAAQVAAMLLLAVWLINLAYGFEGSFKRLGDYRFNSRSLTVAAASPSGGDRPAPRVNRFAGSWLGAAPVPLPENYVLGIDLQRLDFEKDLWNYLRGEWRRGGGWWHYYLYAALVKVPLGTLAIGAIALILIASDKRFRQTPIAEACLLAPAVIVFALVSSQEGMNHHFRYVLPALPFLFVWASRVGQTFTLRRPCAAAVTSIALGWGIISSLLAYPHSLSYFNEFAGGPARGRFHLLSSNTDWGQDMFYLRDWLADHPQARPIRIANEVSYLKPAHVGIDAPDAVPVGPTSQNAAEWPAEMLGPLPGWYAVSVNQLHDVSRDFAYFHEFRPVGRAGYSMLIYHLTPDDVSCYRESHGRGVRGGAQK